MPNYMYSHWGDHHSDTWIEATEAEATGLPPVHTEKQSHIDSFMEATCNIAIGFIISWAVWVWVVAPLFGFHNGAKTSFLVTCVFTVTSLLRQYILRRLFNGRTVWEAFRAKFA